MRSFLFGALHQKLGFEGHMPRRSFGPFALSRIVCGILGVVTHLRSCV